MVSTFYVLRAWPRRTSTGSFEVGNLLLNTIIILILFLL
jgi:hypothetical protein